MYDVMLIGAGQLGSRHLQGLARAGLPLDIRVIDPVGVSLATARQRYEEVAGETGISKAGYFESIESSGCKKADLVIVATNADVRPGVIDELLSSVTVSNLLLEKVVFQSAEIFSDKIALLEAAGVNTWVNCPRRLYPFYNSLAMMLKDKGPVNMEVRGSDWGMGCNAIHFIDLFAFITSEAAITAEKSSFDKTLKQSKRQGFYELTGVVELTNSAGTLRLISHDEPGTALEITIEIPGARYIINERMGECRSSSDKSPEVIITTFTLPFQSIITGDVAADILLSGRCGLTPLVESAMHHKAILPVFCAHFSALTGKELTSCPIT